MEYDRNTTQRHKIFKKLSPGIIWINFKQKTIRPRTSRIVARNAWITTWAILIEQLIVNYIRMCVYSKTYSAFIAIKWTSNRGQWKKISFHLCLFHLSFSFFAPSSYLRQSNKLLLLFILPEKNTSRLDHFIITNKIDILFTTGYTFKPLMFNFPL